MSSEKLASDSVSNPVTIELSDQELDSISGGIDLMLSGSFFEQTDAVFAQDGSGGCGQGKSFGRASKTTASAFQLVGSGFESVNDILAVLAGFARLFGRS